LLASLGGWSVRAGGTGGTGLHRRPALTNSSAAIGIPCGAYRDPTIGAPASCYIACTFTPAPPVGRETGGGDRLAVVILVVFHATAVHHQSLFGRQLATSPMKPAGGDGKGCEGKGMERDGMGREGNGMGREGIGVQFALGSHT